MKVKPIKKASVINCCPHSISLYEGCTPVAKDKYIGGTEVLTIPPSGFLASVKSSFEAQNPVELNGVDIPTVRRNVDAVNELPNNGNIYIVSSLYAQTCKDLGLPVAHLFTPCGNVYDDSGNIIGCTKLVRYA